MRGHQQFFFSSLLLCPKQLFQDGRKMGKTLTWSEGSHSDRFLQGRDEFSFSSQVPSKVQKRYTCPCSTARSKMSHRVSRRRACSTEGQGSQSGLHLHAALPPHPLLSWLEGEAAAWQGKCCTCSLPAPALCCLSSGPRSSCQGIGWLQDMLRDSR